MTLDDVKPVSVEGCIRIPYRWPAGKLGTHFLAALRDEKKILGLRCGKCQMVRVPPQEQCAYCGALAHEWVEVGPRGWIHEVTRRAGRLLAHIVLDGADTGILHRLLADPTTQLRYEQHVVAVFSETRVGSIEDILGFRPE